MRSPFGNIEVRGARENNLKNVSLDIPRRKMTVFTGVSGSGKSSLVFDTIAAESQRLINETFSTFVQTFLPHYGQPDADALHNLSTAILVDQQRLGGTPRSTLGTATDVYTMFRVLFARIGAPKVPHALALSFNDPRGMCPECEGLARVSKIDLDALVDKNKSLAEGAILFPTFVKDGYNWSIFANSGFFDVKKKLRHYTKAEWEKFLYFDDPKVKVKSVGNMKSPYEGLLVKFKRVYLGRDAERMTSSLREHFARIVTRGPCDACGGTRLAEPARACKIDKHSIADVSAMSIREVLGWMKNLVVPSVAPLQARIVERLEHLVAIGLGYLTLSRETATLSGGESQRVKMVRHLGAALTEMTYVFDEPTIGLHPHDIERLSDVLRMLRDKGNTVLVVEHKPEVMAIADHIVDMGPGAGKEGGAIVFEGTFAALKKSGTKTGKHLAQRAALKTEYREAKGHLVVEKATLNNLRHVTVKIPKGVLTVVTGVAGSGKSSLIHGCLIPRHPEAVVVDQSLTPGSRRSNLATYSGMADAIRKAFATANKVKPALFSSNSEGACPACEGLGVIYTDLQHMDPVATRCEACDGRCFTGEVLALTLRGKNINDVLGLSVKEALGYFVEKPVLAILRTLQDVGLGYLALGQRLNTLSGGERQRLKLAEELGKPSDIVVLDEPTTGLHMADVAALIQLLDRMVDNGSTVIVIEHNLDIVARADWVLDMGPGAGNEGGKIVFEGVPAKLVKHRASLTGQHLANRVA
ncbi:ATP-binding cassette domain-containing protein [Pendulispora albinea]|uniref:UvrABC system protein A n=1 Tax=Pendulispora albinea TaxID=2741071 RepID=A0ABZ2MCE8_9BACT